jgi:hypothetical protein
MKINLNEIWGFMEIAPFPEKKDSEDVQWVYELVAGNISIPNLSTEDIKTLNSDQNYDTELLPSIFTYREILWQPNVYTQPALCIPQLNILKVFCEEFVASQKENSNGTVWLYSKLLSGLIIYCDTAINRISATENVGDIRISSILGDLRKDAFPIIKFFIYHPMNRKDYHFDALNRLNYAVKIMLTQYNNKYDDLHDPFWTVSIGSLPENKENEKITIDTPIEVEDTSKEETE